MGGYGAAGGVKGQGQTLFLRYGQFVITALVHATSVSMMGTIKTHAVRCCALCFIKTNLQSASVLLQGCSREREGRKREGGSEEGREGGREGGSEGGRASIIKMQT